ncbi:TPA: hypothetical protein PXQ75_001992, partial [Yersinia enterocolitica]|nr:hypothetical protein [Yersinia enterocolitica]
ALAGLAAANVTLTALQAANERITLAGTLTANINLVLPAWRKSWTIVNNCTGPFSVNCKTPSGTGIAVAAGATARIIGDGTNIISNESPLITGALQKSANLSDLTNAPTARTNLELGTAATKNVGTGVGQIPDMSSFISSFAQNGYFKFPGGLIIQWGEVTGSTTATVPANFPIPFPNALMSTALALDLIGPSYATLQNQTLGGISVNTWNSAGNRAALAIRYIAIGW